MFFPYGTDAPIYYVPLTTILMIVVNVVVFVLQCLYPESAEPYLLEYGNGLHPLQWVTSNFVHGGILHLVGNMWALWSFGLIVEGKLGWYKTLAIFLGIGVLQNVVEQGIMLGASGGGSYGASAIIYGLMAMCLIWAPENEMHCMLIVSFHPIQFDVSVMTMVGTLLAIEVGIAYYTSMALSSAVLHLMGASLGFGVAIWMLKKGYVDCENWDVFSVWAGRNSMSREELEREQSESPERVQQREQALRGRRNAALAEFRRTVRSGRPALALKAHQRMSRELPGWGLAETDLLGLIKAFHKAKQWTDSIPAMTEYLARFPEKSALVRLKLGQILLMESNRPVQALRVMRKIDEGALDNAQRTFLRKLRLKAKERHEADPYEVAEEDW